METKEIKGSIYILEDTATNYYYIGSTTRTLKNRYLNHRTDAKRQPNRNLLST